MVEAMGVIICKVKRDNEKRKISHIEDWRKDTE